MIFTYFLLTEINDTLGKRDFLKLMNFSVGNNKISQFIDIDINILYDLLV